MKKFMMMAVMAMALTMGSAMAQGRGGNSHHSNNGRPHVEQQMHNNNHRYDRNKHHNKHNKRHETVIVHHDHRAPVVVHHHPAPRPVVVHHDAPCCPPPPAPVHVHHDSNVGAAVAGAAITGLIIGAILAN